MKKILLFLIMVNLCYSINVSNEKINRRDILKTKYEKQNSIIEVTMDNEKPKIKQIDSKLDFDTFENSNQKPKIVITKIPSNKIQYKGISINKYNKIIDYMLTQNSKLTRDEAYYILSNVIKYSNEYKVNPYLILAVMNTESHFKHNTVSHAGAMGLMQLMPINLKEFNVTNSISDNIKGGVMHLARDFNTHKDVTKTLVCYNAGCGRLKNNAWLSIKETREYIPKVLKNYNKIKNLI